MLDLLTVNKLQKFDSYHLKSHGFLIGVDEAGRGSLAGPVVAGACLISRVFFESQMALKQSSQINDSKKLSTHTRDRQYEVMESLKQQSLINFTTASASVREISDLNILGATRLAMRRAIERIIKSVKSPEFPEKLHSDVYSGMDYSIKIIVDGRPLKPFPFVHEGVVKGDEKSLVIAMASISAKVNRDREMEQLATSYPQYGFDQHKGYGTVDHCVAIKVFGPASVHRELFLRKIIKA